MTVISLFLHSPIAMAALQADQDHVFFQIGYRYLSAERIYRSIFILVFQVVFFKDNLVGPAILGGALVLKGSFLLLKNRRHPYLIKMRRPNTYLNKKPG